MWSWGKLGHFCARGSARREQKGLGEEDASELILYSEFCLGSVLCASEVFSGGEMYCLSRLWENEVSGWSEGFGGSRKQIEVGGLETLIYECMSSGGDW